LGVALAVPPSPSPSHDAYSEFDRLEGLLSFAKENPHLTLALLAPSSPSNSENLLPILPV